MFREILMNVMSDYVIFEDWEIFEAVMENLPEAKTDSKEDKHKAQKLRAQIFVQAARHVASKLTYEEILQDDYLIYAKMEIENPELFGQ